MSKYLDKLNNKLKLLKFLHEPKTRDECIEELFGELDENDKKAKDRLIRNYMNEGDIKIDNVTIPFNIRIKRDTRESYSDGVLSDDRYGDNREENKSSVHPVILPLNLTEVYMLTNGLLDTIGRNHPLYQSYKELASKIYSQISPYGQRIIKQDIHGLEIYDEVKFTSENEMVKKNCVSLVNKICKQKVFGRVETIDGKIFVGRFNVMNGIYYIELDSGRREPLGNHVIKDVEIY